MIGQELLARPQLRFSLVRPLADFRLQPRAIPCQLLLLAAALVFPDLLRMTERRRLAIVLEILPYLIALSYLAFLSRRSLRLAFAPRAGTDPDLL